MSGTSFNSIKWASKPVKDFKSYLFFLNEENGLGLSYVKDQWIELKNILSDSIKNKCPMS